ncbi:MAG: hypothetical protein WC897_04060 [Candidatus Gracilibacteria bacterium]
MKKLFTILIGFLLLGACVSTNNTDLDAHEDGIKVPTQTEVKYALVTLDGGGATGAVIGCGDTISILTKTEEGDLTEAQKIQKGLEELFSIKDHQVDSYYNALYQSNLSVKNISVNSLNGEKTVKVELSGNITSGGVCDDPRIQEQISYTISSNLLESTTPETAIIEVSLDDKPLLDYFNQK